MIALALALAAIVALAVAVQGGPRTIGTGGGGDPLPRDGRSPAVPAAESLRVLVQLGRPPLGARPGARGADPAGERAYVRSLTREAAALLSALRARGVRLRDPVSFTRVWNGFAVTIRAEDLREVQTLGMRAEPVRRFYPATDAIRPRAEPPRAPPALAQSEPDGAPPGAAPPAIALLDSGVDLAHPDLRGRVVAGYDAVSRRRPAAGAREEHGTALAGVLAAEVAPQERMLALRVAGRRPRSHPEGPAEVGTTDQLLEGLERAVDPDGNGDTDDAVAVALVGVSAPYAGFANAPEARASAAARRLGTLVVAPAGNDGAGAGPYGTLGSPGAAPGTLAVGALDGGTSVGLPRIRVELTGAGGRARLEGTLLGGEQSPPLRAEATGLSPAVRGAGRPLGARPLDYFDAAARPRARGRVVVVPLGPQEGGPALATRAALAAGAGAAALVVCAPEDLPALPRGAALDMPVIGLAGPAARRALALTAGGRAVADLSSPERVARAPARGPAPASSRGPTYDLRMKPDLAAAASAATALPNGRRGQAAGTSVAAARVAAAALALHRRLPDAEPGELAAKLVGTAAPAGDPIAVGAGVADPARAAGAGVHADPPILGLPPVDAGRPADVRARVVLRGPYAAAAAAGAAARLDARSGAGASVQLRVVEEPADAASAPGGGTPEASLDAPGRGTLEDSVDASGRGTPEAPAGPVAEQATLEVRVRTGAGAAGVIAGRVRLGDADPAVSVPFAMAVGRPPPRLGRLRLTRERGARGVRFALGAASRRGCCTRVEPVGRLVLELRDAAGARVRELTPTGGATDLLPGEYAYALRRDELSELAPGEYRFVASARAPAGGAEATASSPPFKP